MNLERYCTGKRVLVQRPQASAYEAARALITNHVGTVVVQDHGRVVGILTDRDLAVRTVGADLDPKQTQLRDVMSPEPATLSIDDDEQQAIALMRARHVRRIPIVENGHAAGIVTLDDLLLAGAIDVASAASIVEAQLSEPADHKPAGGALHPIQSDVVRAGAGSPGSTAAGAARARHTLKSFQARLRAELGISDSGRALAAFEVLVSALMRRLTPDEASDFAAQLPLAIRERLQDLPAGPDPSVTRQTIEWDIAEELQLDSEAAADMAVRVASCLRDCVSAGELSHVLAQLPVEMKQLFETDSRGP
jgi:uncharacterized protein (DUF2267 family)